ncbi:MAG: hypothetical protein IJB96_04325 [Lachnospira sp.]|nr:hypothetical protein [Lachnospira sp.]
MKCSNCGANYDAMLEVCPYCDTVNKKKTLFKKRKAAAGMQYNVVKQQWEPVIQKKSTNQLLNRVLIIEGLVILILFILTIVLSAIESMSSRTGITKGMSKSECIAEVKRLYKEEEFDRMALIYRDADLYNEPGLELEDSMAYFWFGYEDFAECRVAYMEGLKNDDIDDSTINRLIMYMNIVLEIKADIYTSDYDRQNEKYFKACREDVKAFAKGVLKLTDEEIAIFGQNSYLEDDVETEFRKKIKARRPSDYAEQ